MSRIREEATLTPKGGITLPKRIRQALSATGKDKMVFDLHDGDVTITHADTEHHGPAIGALLERIAADIRNGRNVGALPTELAEAMLTNKENAADVDENIEGDVTI